MPKHGGGIRTPAATRHPAKKPGDNPWFYSDAGTRTRTSASKNPTVEYFDSAKEYEQRPKLQGSGPSKPAVPKPKKKVRKVY